MRHALVLLTNLALIGSLISGQPALAAEDEVALVADINPTGHSSPASFAVLGSSVLFSAADGFTESDHGRELWITDGTAAGTRLVKDIDPGTWAGGASSSSPTGLTTLGDRVLFSADDGSSGRELWITDGTESGTLLLKDINGSGDSNPGNFTAMGEALIFSADDGVNGSELWITDGTESGTVLLKDINPAGNSAPSNFTALGSNVVFTANDGTNDSEPWITDGTESGTVLLKDINPTGNSLSSFLAVFEDQLLFTANDGTTGNEPWITDGTESGTVLLKDINPAGNSAPNNFTALGSNVVFRATDGVAGSELWISDGTTAGTRMLKDISDAGDSLPNGQTVLGGLVLFRATSGGDNTELWATDGTEDGTTLVKDINPDGSSTPENMTPIGDHALFRAYDSTRGAELWVTDGTASGTTLVSDINPSGDSNPQGFAVFDGSVLFQANDGTNGIELWVYTPAPAAPTVNPPRYAPSNCEHAANTPDPCDTFGDTEALDLATRQQLGALQGLGIFLGYPDGSFRMGEPLSRAHAVWAVARTTIALGTTLPDPAEPFPDTLTWSGDLPTIAAQLRSLDLVLGHGDGTLRPLVDVTADQWGRLLERVAGHHGIAMPSGDTALDRAVGAGWMPTGLEPDDAVPRLTAATSLYALIGP